MIQKFLNGRSWNPEGPEKRFLGVTETTNVGRYNEFGVCKKLIETFHLKTISELHGSVEHKKD
jgi:hypothetical protein